MTARFAAMISNKDPSIPADTPGTTFNLGRKQLRDQVLDKTSLQILLIHPQVYAKTIQCLQNKSKYTKQFFCCVFREIEGDIQKTLGQVKQYVVWEKLILGVYHSE